MRRAVAVVTLVLAPAAAVAEIQLPPGFTAQVYVSGEGFDATPAGARLRAPGETGLVR